MRNSARGVFLLMLQPLFAAKAAPAEVKAKFETTVGNFEALLYADKAPRTVTNFVQLAKQGFYNGQPFHRIVPKFLIQTGAPQGQPQGGPGYCFQDEIAPTLSHNKAGVLSMANSGQPDTNGSQFFITLASATHLDRRHSIFGHVSDGLEIVKKIGRNDPKNSDIPRIEKITIEGKAPEVPFQKVQVLSEEQLDKLIRPQVRQLLTKISEAQGLGSLQKLRFESARLQCPTFQASYQVNFQTSHSARVLILGKRGSDVRFDHFQFARGHPPNPP